MYIHFRCFYNIKNKILFEIILHIEYIKPINNNIKILYDNIISIVNNIFAHFHN